LWTTRDILSLIAPFAAGSIAATCMFAFRQTPIPVKNIRIKANPTNSSSSASQPTVKEITTMQSTPPIITSVPIPGSSREISKDKIAADRNPDGGNASLEKSPTGEPSGAGVSEGYFVIGYAAQNRKAATAESIRRNATPGIVTQVVDSTEWDNLEPGLFIVVYGSYRSESAAEEALRGLRAQVPDAYIKHSGQKASRVRRVR
jgi:hypothetical protein